MVLLLRLENRRYKLRLRYSKRLFIDSTNKVVYMEIELESRVDPFSSHIYSNILFRNQTKILQLLIQHSTILCFYLHPISS